MLKIFETAAKSLFVSDIVFDRGGVSKSKSIYYSHLQLTGTKKYLEIGTPGFICFGSSYINLQHLNGGIQ